MSGLTVEFLLSLVQNVQNHLCVFEKSVVYILQVFRKGEGGGNIGTFSWIWGRILGIDMDRPENAYFSIKIV